MFGDTTWTVCRGLEVYEEVDSKEAEDENGLAIASPLPEDWLAPEAGATYRRYSTLLPDSSGNTGGISLAGSTAVSPHSLWGE